MSRPVLAMKGRLGVDHKTTCLLITTFSSLTKKLVKGFPFLVTVEAMILYSCVMAVNNESARVAAGHSGSLQGEFRAWLSVLAFMHICNRNCERNGTA